MTSLPTDRPLTVADMLRLADVCERDGYVSNLGTNIRRAFTPAPAPDAALPGGCVLGMGTARSDDEHGYLVHSASGKWWWDIEGKEWRKFSGCEWAGIYSCDFALANPPTVPPPDYTPPAPSKPESVESKPAPSPVEGERVDYGSIGEQAKAWEAVCDTAHEVFPGWHHLTNRGIDSMCVLLRNNASSLAAARAEVGMARAENAGLRDRMKAAVAVVMAVQDWIDKDGSNASHHHLLVCAANYTTVEKGAGK